MMDPAVELSSRWYEECQERGLPTDSYQPLRQGLSDFLPADALAGIAYRDDSPFVIALAAGALVFFEPPEPDQRLDAYVLPTVAFHALSVKCSLESGIRAHRRVCTWVLHATELSAHSIVTRRVVGSGFDSDNGGEDVMLALADRLGWTTPLHQEGAGDGAGAAP